MQLCDYFP
jgi:hypothetical protein